MLAVRKLRIEETLASDGHDAYWKNATAMLAQHLHADDGVQFVSSVDRLVASGRVLQEPWVGVLHGSPQNEGTDLGLEQLREHPTFSANLRSCKGLWVLAEGVKTHMDHWHLPVPVSRIRLERQTSQGNVQVADAAATERSLDELVARVANNGIYRRLPIPRSQAGEFRSFDLTVFIISYKRLENIGRILASLCEQTFSGTFEVIIWNNNAEATDELEEIVAPFRTGLDLTLLHSSRNFYCIVRLALAHLMRSELLMICDDDVQPAAGYLATFTEGLREAGDRAVVCARGNTFQPHKLNWEAPERVWEHWDHLDFWDANAAPREIHFMHGSNCLIPRAALLEIAKIDLPRRDFILVDDYWLSFALSGILGWRIWKIRATDAFRFDKSAEDPEVALFLNDRVREERTNFYVYHMEWGWPAGCGI